MRLPITADTLSHSWMSEAARAKSPVHAVAIARLDRELGSAASAPAS
jgi:hypothetical protein